MCGPATWAWRKAGLTLRGARMWVSGCGLYDFHKNVQG